MLLKISTRRKVQLMVVFCLGFWCVTPDIRQGLLLTHTSACAISIIRLVDIHRYNGSRDPAWDSKQTPIYKVYMNNTDLMFQR
jgi:hypothetical protein